MGGKGGGGGGGKSATAGRNPQRQRWAPRSDAQAKDEGEMAADAALDEEEAPEEASASAAAAAAAPTSSEPAGPSYGKSVLLQVYGVLRGAEQPAQEPDAPEVALKERPAEEARAATPPQQKKKAERPARRLNSSSKMDPNAEAFVPAGHMPTTPSGAQPISLADAVQDDADPSPTTAGAQSYSFGMMPDISTPMHGMGGMGISPEMMHYLYSMAMPPPPSAAALYGAPQPGYTTVMLRNIPNRYSRDMLIDRLNESYKGQFDFVYLPIDFNSKCNVGYAFINFRAPTMAQKFMQEFHGVKAKQCLPGFSSKKVCEVSYATVQGREANMENFRDEKFLEKLKERPEWHPLFFDASGKEIPLGKVLGSNSSKKARRTNSGIPLTPASPYAMMSPTGAFSPFGMGMVPTPFGMMPSTPYAAAAAAAATAALAAAAAVPVMPPPPAPPTGLAGALPGATPATMVMLKNVPIHISRTQLVKIFNEKYKGAFDFMYLPGDFHSANGQGQNRGFAFINFRTAKKAQQFTKDFHEKKVSECFNLEAEGDEKVCEVQQARLQSLEKSIERLQAPGKDGKGGGGNPMSQVTEKAAWYPVMFAPDGDPLPFPLLVAPAGAAKAPGTPGGRR